MDEVVVHFYHFISQFFAFNYLNNQALIKVFNYLSQNTWICRKAARE